MSEAMTSPAQQAAVKAYRAMARRLEDQSREIAAKGYQAWADDLHHMAALARRAAINELTNEEPKDR